MWFLRVAPGKSNELWAGLECVCFFKRIPCLRSTNAPFERWRWVGPRRVTLFLRDALVVSWGIVLQLLLVKLAQRCVRPALGHNCDCWHCSAYLLFFADHLDNLVLLSVVACTLTLLLAFCKFLHSICESLIDDCRRWGWWWDFESRNLAFRDNIVSYFYHYNYYI